MLIRMSRELDFAARQAAKEEGLTYAEWWRRAGQEAITRRKRAQTRLAKPDKAPTPKKKRR